MLSEHNIYEIFEHLFYKFDGTIDDPIKQKEESEIKQLILEILLINLQAYPNYFKDYLINKI